MLARPHLGRALGPGRSLGMTPVFEPGNVFVEVGAYKLVVEVEGNVRHAF